MTKLGLNVLNPDDENVLFNHVAAMKSPAILFYGDRAPTAYACKRAFPNMTVIVRQWPDGELHKRVGAKDFLRISKPISDNGCIVHGHNESGLGAEIIQWEYDLARYGIENKQPVIVLNPATGTYDTPDFDRAKDLLKLAADFPQFVIVGLHAYAGGAATSGTYGGYPDNAGVDPNKPELKGKGKNLIPPENWPTRAEIEKATCFHIGRHRFLYAWCDRNGIKRPRVIYTETSFDYTSDIGVWLNSLKHNGGSVNGFKTLEPQWKDWWPQWDRNTAYVKQMAWVDANQLFDVEAALIFGYGQNPDWVNYNIADTAIPRMLYASDPNPPPPPEPPDEPMPTPDTKAQIRAMIADAMTDLSAANRRVANVIDILNRLDETAETEL
jgi:hypothetical protein